MNNKNIKRRRVAKAKQQLHRNDSKNWLLKLNKTIKYYLMQKRNTIRKTVVKVKQVCHMMSYQDWLRIGNSTIELCGDNMLKLFDDMF